VDADYWLARRRCRSLISDQCRLTFLTLHAIPLIEKEDDNIGRKVAIIPNHPESLDIGNLKVPVTATVCFQYPIKRFQAVQTSLHWHSPQKRLSQALCLGAMASRRNKKAAIPTISSSGPSRSLAVFSLMCGQCHC
jgi:hypothetical protein